ncbi:hypothetical protein MNV49_004440 [Pseudohyphozyma bogoriensis]|nr:hypothetical protein MNV49_004440 [Pseudohyphozyma bogoriensis]
MRHNFQGFIKSLSEPPASGQLRDYPTIKSQIESDIKKIAVTLETSDPNVHHAKFLGGRAASVSVQVTANELEEWTVPFFLEVKRGIEVLSATLSRAPATRDITSLQAYLVTASNKAQSVLDLVSNLQAREADWSFYIVHGLTRSQLATALLKMDEFLRAHQQVDGGYMRSVDGRDVTVDPASGTSIPRSATPVPVADPSAELEKLMDSLKPQESIVERKIGEVYEAWQLGKEPLTEVYHAVVAIGKLTLDVGEMLPSWVGPSVKVLVTLGTLAQAGSGIRETCNRIAEQLASGFELLEKQNVGRQDELDAYYTELRAELLELAKKNTLDKGGFLRRIWFGVRSKELNADLENVERKLSQKQSEYSAITLHGIKSMLANIGRDMHVGFEKIEKRLDSITASGLPGQSKRVRLPAPDPPPSPPDIFGRGDVVDELVSLIESGEHPVLVGTGGIGKSTVATAVLHCDSSIAAFADRRYFFRCDELKSADAVRDELLRIREYKLEEGESPWQALRGSLGLYTTLVVLDNFETPTTADRCGVQRLVSELVKIPSLRLILTTRDPSINPDTPIPSLHLTELHQLKRDASKELFLHISPSHANDTSLDALLALLDDYPLVLRLVAASASRTKRTLATVIKLWEKEGTETLDRSDAREANLSKSLKLSLDVLPPTAFPLLALLVFLPFGLDSSRIEALEAEDLISSAAREDLLNTSLATSVSTGTSVALRLLAPISQNLKKNPQLSTPPLETIGCVGAVLSVESEE